MGVYSGVYEYTQQIRNKYQVYRVYVYLGHLLSCRQDPCSSIELLHTFEEVEEGSFGALTRTDPNPGWRCFRLLGWLLYTVLVKIASPSVSQSGVAVFQVARMGTVCCVSRDSATH